MNGKRIVHTSLYSQIAYDALESVMGQLSDGYWENSPRMQKYWSFADIGRAADGEVVIEVDTAGKVWVDRTWRYYSNPYAEMTDIEILKFFANKMKAVAKVEMKDKNAGDQWRRDSGMELHYLSQWSELAVSEVYCVYEALKGRAASGKYPAGVVERVAGAPGAFVARSESRMARPA